MKRQLTDVARESMQHVARTHFAGGWARARRAGERPSLAALHARGFVVRRAWRGVEGAADAAYEYRLSPGVEKALRAKLDANAAGSYDSTHSEERTRP